MEAGIFHNPGFRRFLIADVLSGFAVGMSTIGTNWYVLTQTGANRDVGLLLAINVIGGLVASLVSGVMTDRYDRRKIVFSLHLMRAIMVAGLLTVLAVNGFQLPVLYLFAAINGFGWTFYMTVSRSWLRDLLDEKGYVTGNSWLEISLQVGMFLAAASAGFIYHTWNFHCILLVTVAMYALAAGSLFGIRSPSCGLSAGQLPESSWRMMTQGWQFLMAHPRIFLLGMVAIVPLVVTMVYNVVLPDYVRHTLGSDSITFGFADMAYGIGGLIAGLLLSTSWCQSQSGRWIVVFYLLGGVNLLVFGHNTVIWRLYLYSGALGLCNSSLRILLNARIMRVVPSAYMGRAMSVWIAISLICQAGVSVCIGGYLDHTGASFGFELMALLMGCGLVLFVLPRWCRPVRVCDGNQE